jgi:Flp pilus assembly protein TadG
MSVEAVLLAPLLVTLVLFIVHVGRISTTQLRLVTIADQAARSASLVHPRSMTDAATSVINDNLTSDQVWCESFTVDVQMSYNTDPQSVTVVVGCTVGRAGLSLLAPVPRQLTASSTEVIDRWRVDS